MTERRSSYDAVIIGGGLIGLACAWRAARRGLDVRVLERRRPGAGASGVAAGMLAPAGEASWGEDALLGLGLASLEQWPGFAAELEAESGERAGYARPGALHVALDRDEAEALRRRHDLHRQLGLDSEWLRPSGCRRLEPGLATSVAAGLHVPGEGVADPVAATAALLSALARLGVPVDEGADVTGLELGSGGCEVVLADGGRVAAGRVLVAAGAWSGAAPWLPPADRPPVRPVKGEILTLRSRDGEAACERIVAGERVYLVPREDGRLIVGATMEERGFDTTVTAGGVHELLREAYRVLPEVAELELVETGAGLRPGTPDNAPVIGPGSDPRLVFATGHHRNGVLLAPVTAEAVSALLAAAEPHVDLSPFSPGRFARAASAQAVAR
ncbi:MAG TPA: glycine oxidase ThiO [Solirubrobacterales bacterium]|nr:glycine oxidase ThiO [Solirubrobacterales bacterium]